ncbi:flavodoxin family protein [Sedimentibacter sp.]|uniref:flavodoxin family protein n=1 Tax=Sedimentibacter sp. TaxID=1960295 RepID=UPI0028B256E2|nr:flavodoxin family protein [Sedimentibacter sp.]
MRVLLFNGSPRSKGCTYTALQEVASALEHEGIETEILQIGAKPVRDCIGCRKCECKKPCIFNDDVVSEWLAKSKEADGFIFGTPVYYAHPSGQIQSVLDRMLFSQRDIFAHKPGAAVAAARRGGTTAALDVLNKYFTINQMPMPCSTYWNMVHGMTPEEVKKDLEGMQTMRNLGRNMAWLLKCIEAGKANGVKMPETERGNVTNFIR